MSSIVEAPPALVLRAGVVHLGLRTSIGETPPAPSPLHLPPDISLSTPATVRRSAVSIRLIGYCPRPSYAGGGVLICTCDVRPYRSECRSLPCWRAGCRLRESCD